jgi:hypothetical protein
MNVRKKKHVIISAAPPYLEAHHVPHGQQEEPEEDEQVRLGLTRHLPLAQAVVRYKWTCLCVKANCETGFSSSLDRFKGGGFKGWVARRFQALWASWIRFVVSCIRESQLEVCNM